MDENLTARQRSALPSSQSMNLYVRAVDPEHRHLLSWNLLMNDEEARVELTTNIELPADSRASRLSDSLLVGANGSAPLTLASRSGVGGCRSDFPHKCKVGEYKRWVKIAQHHSGRKVRSRFKFLKEKETVTGTAVHFQGYGWFVGGSKREAVSRRSYTYQTVRGRFHRVWLARYRFYVWEICAAPASCEKRFEPQNWTGAIRKSKTKPASPSFRANRGFSVRLKRPFGRSEGSNRTFETGLGFKGVELMSRAGYTEKTAMSWKPIGRCNKRWLYGDRRDPTVPTTVYVRSRC